MYTYRGKVIRWIDGDTVLIEIDLGFYTTRLERIRLARINAPELRDEKYRTARATRHTRLLVKKFCPHGSTVVVQTFKNKKDMYARYIAEVILEGENISDYLLEEGGVEEW